MLKLLSISNGASSLSEKIKIPVPVLVKINHSNPTLSKTGIQAFQFSQVFLSADIVKIDIKNGRYNQFGQHLIVDYKNRTVQVKFDGQKEDRNIVSFDKLNTQIKLAKIGGHVRVIYDPKIDKVILRANVKTFGKKKNRKILHYTDVTLNRNANVSSVTRALKERDVRKIKRNELLDKVVYQDLSQVDVLQTPYGVFKREIFNSLSKPFASEEAIDSNGNKIEGKFTNDGLIKPGTEYTITYLNKYTYIGQLDEHGLPHKKGKLLDSNGNVLTSGEWLHSKITVKEELPYRHDIELKKSVDQSNSRFYISLNSKGEVLHYKVIDSDSGIKGGNLANFLLINIWKVTEDGNRYNHINEQGNPDSTSGFITPNGKLVDRFIDYSKLSLFKNSSDDVRLFKEAEFGYPNGDEYEGEVSANIEANGDGCLTTLAGMKYEGMFVNDVPLNTKITFPNGAIYTGEGTTLPDGKGILTFANGEKYEGKWKSGVGSIQKGEKPVTVIITEQGQILELDTSRNMGESKSSIKYPNKVVFTVKDKSKKSNTELVVLNKHSDLMIQKSGSGVLTLPNGIEIKGKFDKYGQFKAKNKLESIVLNEDGSLVFEQKDKVGNLESIFLVDAKGNVSRYFNFQESGMLAETEINYINGQKIKGISIKTDLENFQLISGELSYENGDVYVGSFIDELPNNNDITNFSVLTKKDGTKFQGIFEQGIFKSGTKIEANGIYTIGHFDKDGNADGVCQKYDPKGKLLAKGEWERGVLTKEKLPYLNGEYRGSLLKGKPQGFGVWTNYTQSEIEQAERLGIELNVISYSARFYEGIPVSGMFLAGMDGVSEIDFGPESEEIEKISFYNNKLLQKTDLKETKEVTLFAEYAGEVLDTERGKLPHGKGAFVQNNSNIQLTGDWFFGVPISGLVLNKISKQFEVFNAHFEEGFDLTVQEFENGTKLVHQFVSEEGEIEGAVSILDKNGILFIGNADGNGVFIDFYSGEIIQLNEESEQKWRVKTDKNGNWSIVPVLNEVVLDRKKQTHITNDILTRGLNPEILKTFENADLLKANRFVLEGGAVFVPEPNASRMKIEVNEDKTIQMKLNGRGQLTVSGTFSKKLIETNKLTTIDLIIYRSKKHEVTVEANWINNIPTGESYIYLQNGDIYSGLLNDQGEKMGVWTHVNASGEVLGTSDWAIYINDAPVERRVDSDIDVSVGSDEQSADLSDEVMEEQEDIEEVLVPVVVEDSVLKPEKDGLKTPTRSRTSSATLFKQSPHRPKSAMTNEPVLPKTLPDDSIVISLPSSTDSSRSTSPDSVKEPPVKAEKTNVKRKLFDDKLETTKENRPQTTNSVKFAA